MDGKMRYSLLTKTYPKNYLMEQGTKNGVTWKEDTNEGINWLRFSTSLVRFLNEGNEFYIDDLDNETLQALLQGYSQLRDLYKQSMIPIIKASIAKLSEDKRVADAQPKDYIKQAYEHLDKYGGTIWNDKINTFSFLNRKIKALEKRLENSTTDPNNEIEGGKETSLG